MLIPDPRDRAGEGTTTPPRQTDDLAPLVARCRLGDAVAIKTLLATLSPSMLQMVRRVLGRSHPDVEDVLQDSLVGLLRSLPAFRGDSSTRHFACRIATLSALKATRRRGGKDVISRLDRESDRESWAGVAANGWALASYRRQILRRLLNALPTAQAEALVLHCIAGLTVEEISVAVHCPAETVRSRLRLAKTALRERLIGDSSIGELLEG